MGCTSLLRKKVHKEKSGTKYFIKNDRSKRENILEKIEIHFSCINDYQDLSNLKINLSYSLYPNLNYQTLGETEELKTESKNFETTFFLDYRFEINQYLRISLIQNNNLIETLTTTVGYIVGCRKNTLDLKVGKLDGNFALRVNIRKVSRDDNVPRLYFLASITNIHNLSGDYYIQVLNNHTKPPRWKKVFKTNEGSGQQFRLDIDQVVYEDVCLSNTNRPFKVQLRKFGAGIIGECEVSFKSLMQQAVLNIGTFQLDLRYETRPRLSFFNYLERGLQISLITGIDFTESNEVYTHPKSLHFIYGENPNQYEQALRQCAGVISCYDPEQKFPVYGFGGRLNEMQDTSHFFNVNFSNNPDVYGLTGVINCYKSSLSRVTLSGPTLLAPVIKGVVKRIKEKFILDVKKTNVYSVLLILLSGLILDMNETKQAIFKAAKYPLSIIIVGVGDSDYLDKMEELNLDRLKSLKNKKGKNITRDVAQFVKFEKFKNYPDKFTQEILSKIPIQIEEYFDINHNFIQN